LFLSRLLNSFSHDHLIALTSFKRTTTRSPHHRPRFSTMTSQKTGTSTWNPDDMSWTRMKKDGSKLTSNGNTNHPLNHLMSISGGSGKAGPQDDTSWIWKNPKFGDQCSVSELPVPQQAQVRNSPSLTAGWNLHGAAVRTEQITDEETARKQPAYLVIAMGPKVFTAHSLATSSFCYPLAAFISYYNQLFGGIPSGNRRRTGHLG
ncbi:hypothetical protein BCR39DRAFT_581112, partial [Naematelia encephala]